MEIEFDPDKDRANLAKHGISLVRAGDLDGAVFVPDDRFAGEQRYRVYGRIDDRPYCVAAVIRDSRLRVISFRRAHGKEFRRYGR